MMSAKMQALEIPLTTAGQDQRLCWMHCNAPDVIRVSFVRMNLFHGVVVEDTDLHVVGTSDEPVLPGNEPSTSHRNIANLKILNQLLVFVVHDVYVAIVQSTQNPGLIGM